MSRDRIPLHPAWRFYVSVDKIAYGEFTECSGLTINREAPDFKEGGVNNKVHKLPGRVTYETITLKRGYINLELWQWFAKGVDDHTGLPELREVTITLATASGVASVSWTVKGAYPIKWSGPSLNTSSKDLAMEEIQLAHHGLEIQKLS
jgi:phage tail-like protein